MNLAEQTIFTRTTPATASTLALFLADARLPVAGHTQSGGLEPALVEGLIDVPAYLQLRLRTVVRTEAGTAVVTRAGADITETAIAWAARTPSPAMRNTSVTLGKALHRLGARLWDLPPLPPGCPRPVVLGTIAATAGLGATDLARVVAYDDVQTVAAAALKLMPLDPLTVSEWVVDTFTDIDGVVAASVGLRRPDEIPSRNAPAIEDRAERHAHTTRRLFNA